MASLLIAEPKGTAPSAEFLEYSEMLVVGGPTGSAPSVELLEYSEVLVAGGPKGSAPNMEFVVGFGLALALGLVLVLVLVLALLLFFFSAKCSTAAGPKGLAQVTKHLLVFGAPQKAPWLQDRKVGCQPWEVYSGQLGAYEQCPQRTATCIHYPEYP